MSNQRVARKARLAVSLAAAGLVGCGSGREPVAMTADLERDLDLAVNARPPQTMVVSVLEGGPRGAPSGGMHGRRDAVRSPRQAPLPRQDTAIQEAAVPEPRAESAAPAVDVPEQAEPAPAPAINDADPLLAPEPEPEAGPAAGGPTAAAGNGDGSGEAGQGEAGRGAGRRGRGWGTLIGVIIRGGAAGIDNCEAHDRRRAGRRGPGGYGGGGIAGGGVLGGAIGGVIANGGIRPTFPRY